ncbi:unnamed protein product [Calypogeia fissa]
MVLDVDIREILALAWDNPIFTGGLVLMFTPPMFRVLVFFYPLLICTALCAVALVSFGQQIETSREKEIAGWNAKIVDGDRLSSRLGSATGRDSKSQEVDSWSKLVQDLEAKRFASINEAERFQSQAEDSWSKLVQDLEAKRFASINEAERFKSQGEESWSKLVQDFEAKRSAPHNETERYNWTSGDNNHNEEALKKHPFRVDGGRMENPDGQDVRDNQIDEFRDYERSATGRRSKSQGEENWWKSVQDFEATPSPSHNENERHNWRSSDNSSNEGLKKHRYRVDGSHTVYLDDQELLDRQIEAFREYERSAKVRRSKSQGEENWWKSVQDSEATQSASNNENVRHSWSGHKNNNEEGLKKHPFRLDDQELLDLQVEAFREYERSATGRRSKSQGEESWWKSVQDSEATQSASNNENGRHSWSGYKNNNEEGLKKHSFRLDDQELLDRQIEAFREFERSATGRRSKSQGEESWWKSVQDSEATQSASNNENGRHSWSGYKNNNEEGKKKHPFRLDDQELLDRQIEAFREYERSATGRRSKSQGEESWWKSVQDSEARRSTSNHNTETYNWMNGGNINKEEGLNKHTFRVDGGRMEFPDGQDVRDRQIEDFGEYDRSPTGRRSESQGEESWWKSVQDSEARRSTSNHDTETYNWMNGGNINKEEGLNKHTFRVDGGRMEFPDGQDVRDRQIEDFGEYDRSATGRRSESQGEDSWRKSVQDFEATRSASNDENGRHSWTGSYNNHSEEGLKKHPFRVDGGKMVFLDDQDILDRQIEAFREYERKFSMKTRAPATTAGDIGSAAASRGGGSPGISSNSSPSTRTTSVSEERYSNSDVPTAKIPPTFLYTLRTGGTGSAVKASSGKKAQAPSSFAPGPPAPAKNSQEGRIGPEGLSNSYGNVDSSASMKQRGTQPPFPWQKPGNVFETGKIAMTRTAEMEPNVFAKVKNSNHNAPTKNYTWPGVIKPNHQFEGESAGGFTKPFEGKEKDYSRKTSTSTQKGPAIISSNGASPARRSEESRRDPKGKESLKRFFSVRGPVIDSGRAASPSKQVEERSLRRAPTYNAALRSGNAVLYNAGSDSNAMSLRRKGHGSVHRK